MMDKTFGMIVLGIFLSLAILVGVTAVNPTFASNFSPAGGHGMKPDIRKMLNQLDLSMNQRTQIRSLIQNFKKEIKPQRQALMETRNQVLNELVSDQLSDSQTRALIRNASTKKEELVIALITMVGEIKKILTPEQVEKLTGLQKAHLAKIKERSAIGMEGSNPWN